MGHRHLTRLWEKLCLSIVLIELGLSARLIVCTCMSITRCYFVRHDCKLDVLKVYRNSESRWSYPLIEGWVEFRTMVVISHTKHVWHLHKMSLQRLALMSRLLDKLLGGETPFANSIGFLAPCTNESVLKIYLATHLVYFSPQGLQKWWCNTEWRTYSSEEWKIQEGTKYIVAM